MDKHGRPYNFNESTCDQNPGFTYSGGLLAHEREVHGQGMSSTWRSVVLKSRTSYPLALFHFSLLSSLPRCLPKALDFEHAKNIRSWTSSYGSTTHADKPVGVSKPKKYRSQMMTLFKLESLHRGTYIAGTLSTQQRTAIVAAQLDRILVSLDGVELNNDISVTTSSSKL